MNSAEGPALIKEINARLHEGGKVRLFVEGMNPMDLKVALGPDRQGLLTIVTDDGIVVRTVSSRLIAASYPE